MLPLAKEVMDDCAHACDGLPGKCDGFKFMDFNDGMCFFFESAKSAQQWTGCGEEEDEYDLFRPQCIVKHDALETRSVECNAF